MPPTTERTTKLLPFILGALAALGPLTIDMYLPALPSIAHSFNTSEGTIQLSLMAFFIGLVGGQLFYGPLSDKFGRKPLTLIGLAIFVIASLACGLSGSSNAFIAFRFFQGLGGSIGMVISFAVVRDLFTGLRAAKLMALVTIVLGVAPVIAPLIGGLAASPTTWRFMFYGLSIFGVLLILLVAAKLPETRLAELRKSSKPSQSLSHYANMLRSRHFIGFALTLCVAQAGFFAYVSSSSAVFISVFAISPTLYSLLFALNAVGIIICAQLNAPLSAKFSPYAVVRGALLVFLIAALGLVAQAMTGAPTLVGTAACLFVLVAMLGFIIPSLSTLTMEGFGAMAGSAAALMGAFQYGAAAITSGLTGALFDDTALPMAVIIVVCAALAAFIGFTQFPKRLEPMAHTEHA